MKRVISLIYMLFIVQMLYSQKVWHSEEHHDIYNYISLYTTSDTIKIRGGGRVEIYAIDDNGKLHQLRPQEQGSGVVAFANIKYRSFHKLGCEVRIFSDSNTLDIEGDIHYAPEREDRHIVVDGGSVDLAWYLSRVFDRQVSASYPDPLVVVKDTDNRDSLVAAIREKIMEPESLGVTTDPVTQRREPQIYEWLERHNSIIRRNREINPRVVVMGNSIMHYWGGEPLAPIARDSISFVETFGSDALNMGCGWDRTENLLWRIYHDEIYGISPEKVFITIGINNITYTSTDDIAQGISQIAQATKDRLPHSDIALVSVMPSGGYESKVAELNDKIKSIAESLSLRYVDIYSHMVAPEGKIDPSLFLKDGLHPNKAGYQKIAPLYR